MYGFLHPQLPSLRHFRPSPKINLHPTCQNSTSTPSPPHPLLHSIIHAPSEPGVYRFLSPTTQPLYIGKARSLRSRLRYYISLSSASSTGVVPAPKLSPRLATMVSEATALDFIVTKSEAAALALEATMVREYRPRFNVLLKDDRRYPYVKIMDGDFPRLVVTRDGRGGVKGGGKLFGPFVDEGRMRRMLKVVAEVFPMQQRARPLFSDRVCINYDMGRCPGVCQGLISVTDYAKVVERVERVLGGGVWEVTEEMREEMKELSGEMKYEEAGRVRDRLRALERVFGEENVGIVGEVEEAANVVDEDSGISRDVFGLAVGEGVAKVVVVQMRGGKVISRLVFGVEVVEEVNLGEILEGVVMAHYGGVTHAMDVPEEVVLGERVADVEGLKRVLREKRGKIVRVRVGKGKLSKLMGIVQRNAEVEVGLEERREKEVGQGVRELEEMLTPYFSAILEGREREGGREHGSQLIESLSIKRIEGYDISHTSGANAVGSKVVFVDGVPTPTEYRKYHLDEGVSWKGHPDDFESIRQVLRRRFMSSVVGKDSTEQVASSIMPDLLLIDGGKGQLSAALDVLHEFGLSDKLPVVGLAKGEEEIFVPGRSESINYDEETQVWVMNSGVRLLCRVRDEAHRFAVQSHRKRRGRQALKSGLDSVPGLGPVKKEALLSHFNGSSEAIAASLKSDLEKASGIGSALAQRIFDHFH